MVLSRIARHSCPFEGRARLSHFIFQICMLHNKAWNQQNYQHRAALMEPTAIFLPTRPQQRVNSPLHFCGVGF
jgi:hypothetical protein